MVTAASDWQVWSTTARVVVTDPGQLGAAVRLARTVCDEVELACSRFRDDSEILRRRSALAQGCEVSDALAGIVRAALAAAEDTDGTVDPTLGNALLVLGYDRDFALLAAGETGGGPGGPPGGLPIREQRRTPAWHRIRLEGNRLTVPADLLLDLGAVGKALAADWAASRISDTLGCGSMVSLGGDLATAGSAPPEGWRVLVQDLTEDPATTVALEAGFSLATSSTQKRRWDHQGRAVHHIIDPQTGLPAEAFWRTVTVAAASCAEANAVSTSCIVRGRGALAWLKQRGHPARLVDNRGRVLTVCGWPEELS